MDEMLMALEDARLESKVHSPIFALSDGREVIATDSWEEKNLHEQNGYWLVSIFEDGYRVEV